MSSQIAGDAITGVYTDGVHLLIYHNTQFLKFYNLTSKNELVSFKLFPKMVYKDYFPKQLIVVCNNHSMFVIDYTDSKVLPFVLMFSNEHTSSVLGAIINVDFSHVISYDYGGKIVVWDIFANVKMVPSTATAHKAAVRGVVYDAENSRLVSWSDDSKIKIWNYVIDAIVMYTQFNDHTTPVVSLQLDAKNNKMFSFARGAPIAVWQYNMQFVTKYLLTPDQTDITLNLNVDLGLFLV